MDFKKKFFSILSFAAAFAALGLALGFYRLVPWTDTTPPPPFLPFLPTPELCVLFAFGFLPFLTGRGSRPTEAAPGAAGSEESGPPAGGAASNKKRRANPAVRAGSLLLSVLLGILMVWNLGEWFYRFFYRGDFDPVSDMLLVPGLFDMVFQGRFFATPWGQLVTWAIGLLVCGGFGALLLMALRRVWAVLRTGSLRLSGVFAKTSSRSAVKRTRERAVLWSLFGLLLALGVVQYLFIPAHSPVTRIAWSVAAHLGPQLGGVGAGTGPVYGTAFGAAGAGSGFGAGSGSDSSRGAAILAKGAPRTYKFPGTNDGDVLLFVVESYGHTIFTNPAHQKLMKPVYEWMSAKIAALGWSAASGFLRSPTYGGRSWLADSTILTGVRIKNQQQYDDMAQSGGPNLTQFFGSAGYSRLLAAPGTTSAEDYWKKTYAFDRYMFDPDFGYKGPYIAFGRLSDQYLLEHVGLAMAEMKAPHFVMTIMTSSHVPYERVPVYFDDWSMLGDGSIYYKKDSLLHFHNDWLQGGEYPEGYVTSIEYVFKSIEGFLERYPNKDALIVILGDHQPRIPISEESATFSVPVHILYKDAANLVQLEKYGFDPGFVPAGRPLPHHGMEEIPSIVKTLLFNDPRENQKTVTHDPVSK